MRRGFKAWSEKTTAEYRESLDLKLDEKLDVEALAKHLNIEVMRPQDVPGLSKTALDQLTVVDPSSWSAITLRVGAAHLSIVNSSHSTTRQRSSLVHEFAHIILDHGPGRIDISPAGHLLLSSYEKDHEDEADWLSGALLVPRAGLQKVYGRFGDVATLANHFDVSEALLQWRLRMTGVAVQAKRSARRR